MNHSRQFFVRDLHVSVEKHEILHGVNLRIFPGEIHLLVGPNGSGKSTLCNAIAGHPLTHVTHGSVTLDGSSLLRIPPHARAAKGLFLGFQQPTDIPGITLAAFLRSAKNSLNAAQGKHMFSAIEFAAFLKDKLAKFGFDERFGGKGVNVGLSGGEKKRAELLQMIVLEPRYALLDEFDSGLDVDALRHTGGIIAAHAKKGMGFLLISHNPRIHEYVPISAVHLITNGTIQKSGGRVLLSRIAKNGYKKHD